MDHIRCELCEPVECNICSLKLKNKRSLAGHLKRVHPTSIPRCNECDLMFSTEESFNKHIQQKHSQREYKIIKVPKKFDERKVQIPYPENYPFILKAYCDLIFSLLLLFFPEMDRNEMHLNLHKFYDLNLNLF